MKLNRARNQRSFVLAAALLGTLGLYANCPAAQGDCGQPVSDGPGPVSTDCLFILNAAIGLTTCTPECICNLNGVPPVTSTDALMCLNVAVGNPPPDFPNCPCDSTTTTSSSTTTTTSTTSTTMSGPQACGDTDAPECDGTCGLNEACTPSGGSSCSCEKLGCGDYMGPALCFGLCPQGSICVVDGGSACQCVPSATGCNTAGAPRCNGICPDGGFCALDEGSGQCLCNPVGCGDFGPAPSCLGVCPPASVCESVDSRCSCVSSSQ